MGCNTGQYPTELEGETIFCGGQYSFYKAYRSRGDYTGYTLYGVTGHGLQRQGYLCICNPGCTALHGDGKSIQGIILVTKRRTHGLQGLHCRIRNVVGSAHLDGLRGPRKSGCHRVALSLLYICKYKNILYAKIRPSSPVAHIVGVWLLGLFYFIYKIKRKYTGT